MTSERRRHLRVPGPFPASLSAAGHQTRVRVLNLSEGGCYVDGARDHIAPGTPVVLEIALPDTAPISVKGHAVFAHPDGGFGMLFATSDSATTRLEGAIAQLRRLTP